MGSNDRLTPRGRLVSVAMPLALCGLLVSFTLVLLWAARLRAEDSLAERKKLVAAMSDEKKEDLRIRNEKFLSLPQAEQQRIRTLHEQLQAAPDGPKLRETMRRYCQWLSNLSPITAADINLEKTPEQRAAKVVQILEEQNKARGNRLSKADHQAIVKWMGDFAAKHEPPGVVAKGDPNERRHMYMWVWQNRWQAPRPMDRQPAVSEAELAVLKKSLSKDAQDKLAGKSPADVNKQLFLWLHDAARQELGKRKSDRNMPLPGLDEQLAEYFETIPKEDQEWLTALPGEEMQQQLRGMYFRQLKPGDWPGRGDRPGPGGNRGGRNGGGGIGGPRDPKDSGTFSPGGSGRHQDDRAPRGGPRTDGPWPNGPPPDGPPPLDGFPPGPPPPDHGPP